jgi:glycosyltransferase involved in cell wall biosynthesis
MAGRIMDTSCSVVVPVYNSQGTLHDLVNQLGNVLPGLFGKYEVILINDGSLDDSWQVIQELVAAFSWVRGIDLMRNYGQHNAILCGVRDARFDIVVTMDDDLQHPPDEIGTLYKKLLEGYDVVYGTPKKLPHSLWRNIFSRLTKILLAFVMNVPTVRNISAFRIFKTELRKAFVQYQHPGVILDVLLSWGTSRFSSVQVDEAPRQVGVSNYNLYRLVNQAFFILTGYSTFPLRFASMLGFLFTVFGFGILIYVLSVFFIEGSIPGFTFLASIIVIFSGTQLITLGIFGEYLARIFDRSLERPAYVVHRVCENTIESNCSGQER